MSKKYYHLCVRVYTYDEDAKDYQLWYIETFSSKKNYEIWRKGFTSARDTRKIPLRNVLGEPFVKYRTYKPNI